MSDLIEDIRNQNIEWYGKSVLQDGGPEWGDIFTEKMYRDRTHFVYELLQNAEDACERKRKLGGEENFKISFKLNKGGLEVRHNGITFDDDDVKRICLIGRTKGKRDVMQIGKFGIGFKSVYAYTRRPEIYSGNNAFCIKNLVLPKSIEMRRDVENEETLFFIPFNHKEVTPEKAYEEIGNRLKNLGVRTLLFIRNISEICWEIDGDSGKYSRTCEFKDGYRWVTLYKDDKIFKKWLVFEKPIQADGDKRLMEVAYLFEEDIDKNLRRIVKAKNTELVVHFPTEKETHLNFLIQGPFNTTATRENILNDNRNKMLITEIADFVADTISKIKFLRLFDVNFLNALPIDTEHFSEETNFFKPIYDKVKEKLSSEEELFPADDGSYVSAKNALLVRGADLRVLLSNGQLPLLFNRTKWLKGEITQDKLPLLREYLMNELEVPEIDSKRFARIIDEKFIKEQTDDWIIKFYEFLHGQQALWRKRSFGESEGVLRSKPIIRLEDGTHVAPFDKEGKPRAYLPSENITSRFPTVKKVISSHEEANKFLKKLGLGESNYIDEILHYIIPRYKPRTTEEEDIVDIKLKDNFEDVLYIKLVLEESKDDPRKNELLDELKRTKFLYAKNMSNGNKRYHCPENIYLGETYTSKKDIEIFFEGNDKIWLLDDGYKEDVDADIEILKEFGCKDKIYVRFREPSRNGHVVISSWSWNYTRGLNGFDPDAKIEGLEHALNEITFEKSKIIWNLLTKYYKQIRGYVEFSTNQNYNPSSGSYSKDLEYSKMGELLLEKPWLYTERDLLSPHKPTKIMLSELSKEYGKECPEAKIIAEYLNFKTPVKEELREKMKPEEWEVYEAVEKATRFGIKDEVIEFIRKRLEDKKTLQSGKSPSELKSELESILVSTIEDTNDISGETIEASISLTPEEEEEMQRVHGKEIPKILNRLKLKRKVKTSVDAKATGGINMDQFLLDQYGGHCQICNVKLFLGNKERGKNGVEFVTTHLIETRNKKAYADMEWNVLCLCPNHFALFKYGITDLKGIWELSKKVLNGEIVAEWIEERKGYYYIAKIKMMKESGRLEETELFYSQNHMRKIVAFIKTGEEEK